MTRDRDETRPEADPPAGPAAPAAARIEEGARLRIGRDLRRLYAGVLDQPLPDRLTRLVNDLTSSTDREGPR